MHVARLPSGESVVTRHWKRACVSASRVEQKVTSSLSSFEISKKNLLFAGIVLDDLEFIKKWIDNGGDVNQNWIFGQHSIFTRAVEQGNLEIIAFLIRNGAKVSNGNVRDKVTPLVVAIRNNCRLEIIQLLVENGADVNEMDKFGRTPLNEALTFNNIRTVKYLLTQGVDVNQTDSSGKLPIYLAIVNNSLEIVELLVSKGANVFKSDSEDNTALTLARRLNFQSICLFLECISINGNLSVYQSNGRVNFDITEFAKEKYESLDEVKFLLAEEATEDKTTQSIVTNKSNDNHVYALSSNNDSEGILDVIKIKSNNNAPYEDIENKKPSQELEFLQKTILEGELENLKLLLNQELNINDVDHEGFTLLTKAICCENVEIVKYLLTSGANTCKAVNGKTPLSLAVEKQNLALIQLLFEYGAEHTMQTAFLESVKLGNLEIVQFFIQKGVNINMTYKCGCTPLIKSIELMNFELVKQLVKNGADVNMIDRNENLPITVSLEYEDIPITRYLFESGARLSDGTTIKGYLEKYIRNNKVEMVKIIVELLEQKLDIVLSCGHSPLTKATEMGNFEMVKYLLQKCNVNYTNRRGKTALAIAAENQFLPMIKYLINIGANINLAKQEIDECEKCNEDFALYLDTLRKENHIA